MVKKVVSMSERRVNTLENTISLTRRSQTLPSAIKPTVIKPTTIKPNAIRPAAVKAPTSNIRKIQPLSKEQLEEVFAKYKVNTTNIVKPTSNFAFNESTIEEENSTDFIDRKSDASSYELKAQKIQELYETFGEKMSESSSRQLKIEEEADYESSARINHISSDYVSDKSGATLEPKVEDEVEKEVEEDEYKDDDESEQKVEEENEEEDYANADFEDEKEEKGHQMSEYEEDD